MKSFKFKFIITAITFSLSVLCVWSLREFSYFSSILKVSLDVSEVSSQTIETSNKILPESRTKNNQQSDLPKLEYPFKNYPTTEIYKGKIAPPKLTREEKESPLGEKLLYSLENYNPEVNFAGHYIVETYSCGMWCHYSVILDAKTGKIYSWNGISSFCFPELDTDFACNENFSEVEYRVDSNLIIFFGSLDYDKDRGFHYYKFENGKLIHLKSVLVKEQRSTSDIEIDRAEKKAASNSNSQ